MTACWNQTQATLVGFERSHHCGCPGEKGVEGVIGRWERKGWEVGDLRGWEAGEKCETLIFLIQQCITILSKTRTQNIFEMHLTSSRSLLRLLSKRKFALGLKNRLNSGEIANPFTVVTSWVMKCQAA